MTTTYTTTVTKVPSSSSAAPEDAASKSHHVLSKTGKFVRFRNTYDSWNKLHDGSVFPIILKLIG